MRQAIYAIECCGLTKIGRSSNPKVRFAKLASKNKSPIGQRFVSEWLTDFPGRIEYDVVRLLELVGLRRAVKGNEWFDIPFETAMDVIRECVARELETEADRRVHEARVLRHLVFA